MILIEHFSIIFPFGLKSLIALKWVFWVAASNLHVVPEVLQLRNVTKAKLDFAEHLFLELERIVIEPLPPGYVPFEPMKCLWNFVGSFRKFRFASFFFGLQRVTKCSSVQHLFFI